MKLLLDTHIWLWSLLEPRRLSRRVTKALTAPDTELWLSPISVWEVLLLAEKRRLELDRAADAWVAEALSSVPMREAPVTHEIARATRLLRLPHEDPADRFLAATAKVLELTLVTADDRLIGCSDVAILSNHRDGARSRRTGLVRGASRRPRAACRGRRRR